MHNKAAYWDSGFIKVEGFETIHWNGPIPKDPDEYELFLTETIIPLLKMAKEKRYAKYRAFSEAD